jgi:apolipoprotein N-acyltransferase
VKLFSYSLISALLLSAGWPVFGFSPLLFIGFLPLLFVEQRMLRDNSRHAFLYLFLYTYLCFIIWNLSVSWWICLASPGGAVAAILENALVMALVFTTAHVTKKMLLRIFKNNLVQRLLHYNLVFIIFWLAFEYLNHNWDLAYPWLTLGNGLAGNHRFIQWYEYTGVLGGSLWILSVNVLLYNYLSDREFQYKFKSKRGIAIILLVFVPALISLFMYSSQPGKQSGLHSKIMVVQPNIDPYHEKFDGSFDLQLKKMLELASTKLDTSFNYLVFPETALTENIWENELDQSESLQTIQVFLKKYPRLIIVTGARGKPFRNRPKNGAFGCIL